MHYESLLRAGYSSVLYKNAYAPAHAAAAAAAAAASSSSSSSANSETIADAVTAGRRKEVAIREDGSSGGSSGTVMGTNAESANASRDESSPSAPKRKRHSSHAASRASKNERKSTGGSGNSSRPAAAAAAEPAVAKKRRSDRSRLTSLTSAARRSNSVDSQELADEETIADTNAERNNSHPNRPRKTSYVSQQESSYDIDNIIPYGMMSCTRLVERLKYKEILTPKWRLVHISPEGPSAKAVAASPGEGLCSDAILTPPDGLDTNSSTSALDGEEIPDRDKDVHIGAESGELACDGGGDDDIEDVSDSALQTRHARQEALERERFSAYLKPKLSHQSGPSSTSSVSAGANSRRARIDSATDINTTSGGGGLRSKESSAPGTSSKVKESEESGIHSGSDRGPPTPAAGGKSKEDVSSSHSTKAKRQHRSMSQDWTMLQSSTAPTPYAPRQFPLSDAEWERMQSENPVQSSGGTTTAATTIGDKEDKADAGLQEPAVFADENLFVN
ncbi:hypothetical protein BIW11_11458 [Tropilaelaps mercedesae]|uniref:PEHE domain-containing protein n=1 Tax=Tropilaelaps mercedesae TaxID=418985 RepID=A0A1V9XBC6_9ACAR|nr:hypothetical protein BIW11_11458 [Tropilaelaps mercedesae]